MRSSIKLASLALVVLASGCASAARSSQAACAAPEVDSSGWQRVEQGAATLLIPANLEERPAESARERRFMGNDQVVVVAFATATSAAAHPLHRLDERPAGPPDTGRAVHGPDRGP